MQCTYCGLTKEQSMTDYLPEVYHQFERRYPVVKEAFDALGSAEHDAGPLGERERRLIKLGIAVGAGLTRVFQ
jgi:4-carboxymuconolactone decarboxylase